jgi:hypothetical protein
VLFIWELIGLDLDKAKEAGGNAGTIITAIKSPQAVPWVLLILVGYFLFRFTVEWYQSNASRRKMTVARIDFYSSWFICQVKVGTSTTLLSQLRSRGRYSSIIVVVVETRAFELKESNTNREICPVTTIVFNQS